ERGSCSPVTSQAPSIRPPDAGSERDAGRRRTSAPKWSHRLKTRLRATWPLVTSRGNETQIPPRSPRPRRNEVWAGRGPGDRLLGGERTPEGPAAPHSPLVRLEVGVGRGGLDRGDGVAVVGGVAQRRFDAVVGRHPTNRQHLDTPALQ